MVFKLMESISAKLNNFAAFHCDGIILKFAVGFSHALDGCDYLFPVFGIIIDNLLK